MQTLSTADAKTIFAKLGNKLWINGEPCEKSTAVQRTIELGDGPASKILWFARSIVDWLYAGNDTEAYAWVRDWGIWPDSENYHLFYAWRRIRGSGTSLEQESCHYFFQGERLDCVDLVFMSMLFGWDVLLITKWGDRAVFSDHDGDIILTAIDSIVLDALTISIH